MKRVILISGSYPPDICGVGDYTHLLHLNLIESKKYINIEFSIFLPSIKLFYRYFTDLIKRKFNIIHMQYPTEGYGYSVLPMMLFFLMRGKATRIVTIHEYSQRSTKARIATSLLFYFSDHIIFTTNFERNEVIRKFKFVKFKSSVINIASNIPSPKLKTSWEERGISVAYFGHLRPNKGIEDFIDVIKIIRESDENIDIRIIGQVQKKYISYYESLRLRSMNLNIKFTINESESSVSEILQQTKILFLPFPDGLSMRRGSFLAGVENGCLIISNHGKFDVGLEKLSILFDQSTSLTYKSKCILEYLTLNEELETILNNLKQERKNLSWSSIAKRHLNIYEKI